MLIHGGLSLCALAGMTIIEGEVGGVIGHGMLACGNVYLDAAEG